MKTPIRRLNPLKQYLFGRKFANNDHYLAIQQKNEIEVAKHPSRTAIINFLLSLQQNDTTYLEIGVRNPNDNYNHIKATKKYSVDPGAEYKLNPVDFKLTSDVFFQKLGNNEILSNDIRFDVIFVDGLHLAEQVDRDIVNSLNYLKDDGFVVLHDCNPPSEWHARENFQYKHTPAHGLWNGTTWKAFLKWRFNTNVNACCIDTDWGVGVVSKTHPIGKAIAPVNPFFEFSILDQNRKEHLNLVDFETFKKSVKQ
jgi:hypothetical protein